MIMTFSAGAVFTFSPENVDIFALSCFCHSVLCNTIWKKNNNLQIDDNLHK